MLAFEEEGHPPLAASRAQLTFIFAGKQREGREAKRKAGWLPCLTNVIDRERSKSANTPVDRGVWGICAGGAGPGGSVATDVVRVAAGLRHNSTLWMKDAFQVTASAGDCQTRRGVGRESPPPPTPSTHHRVGTVDPLRPNQVLCLCPLEMTTLERPSGESRQRNELSNLSTI